MSTAIDFLTGRCTGVVRTCVPPPHRQTQSGDVSRNLILRPPSLAAVALETMPLRPSLDRQLSR